LDGIDLSPAIGGTEPAHRVLYGESLYVRYHFGWSEQRMLLDWPLKYVGSTHPQLFDISADPTEQQDLVADRAEDAERLASVLAGRPAIGATVAAEIDPDTARRLEALGYVAERVTVDENAILPDPKDKTELLARFAMARAAMHENKFSKARQLLAKVVDEEPELVDPRLTLAQVQMRTGDVDKAMEQIEAVDRLSPGSSRVLELKATALAMTGRTDEAVAAVEQALAVDDQQARTWGLLLQVLFESRRYDALVPAADRADAALPGIPSVAGYRGAALIATGHVEDARPHIDRALAQGGTPPWAHSAAGVLSAIDGDQEGALYHYLAEHEAYPEHLEALYAAVLTMSQLGRNEDVLEYAALALTANPQAPDMHRVVGQAQFNNRDYEACHASVGTCLQIDPEHPDCTMLLANVLKKLGRDAEAEEAFQQALQLAKERLPDADVQGLRK
jgi:Flp pilus assembly protein TadD